MSAPHPLLSPSGALYRSSVQAGLLSGKYSQFQIVVGLAPLWGFGAFDSSSSPATGIGFRVTWPYIYQTLTETWAQSDGNSRTTVTEWKNFVDTPKTVTTTGAGGILDAPSGTGWTSITDSTAAATWSGTYAGHSVTVNYTATLTDYFDPVTGWAGKVGQAAGLMGNVDLPLIRTPSNVYFPNVYDTCQNQTQVVVPVTTATSPDGWQISGSGYGAGGHYIGVAEYSCVVAAANGVGVKIRGAPVYPSWITFADIFSYQAQPSIDDLLEYNATGPASNIGAVICVKSRWRLTGIGPNLKPGFPPAIPPNDTNHQTIYGQKIDFSGTGGSMVLGSVITPSGFRTAGQVVANGASRLNPIGAWPTDIVFGPADVGSNLYAPTDPDQYGLLGFRSTTI